MVHVMLLKLQAIDIDICLCLHTQTQSKTKTEYFKNPTANYQNLFVLFSRVVLTFLNESY